MGTVNRSGSSCGFRSVGYTFQVSLFVPRRVFARLLTYQLFQVTMSMFSGLTNQISGWVANKTGQGDPNADPNAQQQQQMDPNYAQNGAEGEVPMEGDPNAQGQGGAMGMAQGFLAKAMIGNITSMIPGQRREEEVPNPPEQGVDMSGGDMSQMQGQMQGQMVDPNQQYQYDQTQYQQ